MKKRTKLICVIEDGWHILYTPNGERLDYVAETIVTQSAVEEGQGFCTVVFTMFVNGTAIYESKPSWKFRAGKLISPKGVNYEFDYSPIIDEDGPFPDGLEGVEFTCIAELRNEVPK